VLMLACPSSSFTWCSGNPCASQREPASWRRSWKCKSIVRYASRESRLSPCRTQVGECRAPSAPRFPTPSAGSSDDARPHRRRRSPRGRPGAPPGHGDPSRAPRVMALTKQLPRRLMLAVMLDARRWREYRSDPIAAHGIGTRSSSSWSQFRTRSSCETAACASTTKNRCPSRSTSYPGLNVPARCGRSNNNVGLPYWNVSPLPMPTACSWSPLQ
jgi:hypothetical protein